LSSLFLQATSRNNQLTAAFTCAAEVMVCPTAAGEPCEAAHSTCGGRNELCIGRGPAWEADDHGFTSNAIIAGRQADRARSLFQDAEAPALDVTGVRTAFPWFGHASASRQPCPCTISHAQSRVCKHSHARLQLHIVV
jgi:hypothetical protein